MLSKNEQVFLDVISAEVDQIESPLSSPLTPSFHSKTHVSKLKRTKKDRFKTKMLRFRAAQ